MRQFLLRGELSSTLSLTMEQNGGLTTLKHFVPVFVQHRQENHGSALIKNLSDYVESVEKLLVLLVFKSISLSF